MPGSLEQRRWCVLMLTSGVLVTAGLAAHSGSEAASGTGVAGWIGAVTGLVTAFGVVATGVFAYFKFFRGRLFEPRVDLELKAAKLSLAQGPAMKVDVTVRNIGQTVLMFADEYLQQLLVVGLEYSRFASARKETEPVRWANPVWVFEQDILADEGSSFALRQYRTAPEYQIEPVEKDAGEPLEAGVAFRRSILVPIPEDRDCFLVIVRVNACSHYGGLSRHSHEMCRTGQRPPVLWEARQVVHLGGEENELASVPSSRKPRTRSADVAVPDGQ
jgi:hypothetical protein